MRNGYDFFLFIFHVNCFPQIYNSADAPSKHKQTQHYKQWAAEVAGTSFIHPFKNLIYTTLPSIISSYPFIILIIFSNYHNHLLYLPYLCSSFTHLVDLIILLSLDFMKVPRSASKYMTLFPSSLFYHKSSSR